MSDHAPPPSSPLDPRRQPQPKLTPRGPETKKDAAKEAFLDAILNARSLAGELVEDFRASDRFFKYKAGVLAGWLALSAASLFIACPGADPGAPSNSLDARVKVQKVATLDRPITALYIENQGGEDWAKVTLTLNNTYSAAIPAIPAGKKAVIQLEKFSGSDGKTPPAGLKPQKLEISCSVGEASFELEQ